MQNLILIGFMGSGKTEVGRTLAQRLNRPFYDTDHLVEQATGLTISQIFEQEGETTFRQLESRMVRQVARQRQGAVIATGGGALLKEANRRALRESGWLIYLRARPETLWARVQGDPGRPLLAKASDPFGRLKTLLAKREPFYAESDWQIDTDNLTPEQVAEQILPIFCAQSEHPLTIPVDLGERGYKVEIAPHLLGQVAYRLGQVWQGRRVVVLTHPVLQSYADVLMQGLNQAGLESLLLTVPAGERSKSLHQAERLYTQLASAHIDRSSLLLSLGGGVIGDLGGFVAATYLRGIPYVQIPTTLLAQVDSSVGGKVGVDLKQGKNLVGAFYQPMHVFIDPLTLRTLPARQFRSGLAEVIKYGVILDRGLFKRIETIVEATSLRHWAFGIRRSGVESEKANPTPNTQRLTPLIGKSVLLKASLVQADEKDLSGRRALLNFGHTVGHAVESCRGYRGILHGEAIAMGMVVEAEIGHRMGVTPYETVGNLQWLLEAAGLPTRLPLLSSDALLEAMQKDKKTRAGRLHIILPEQIGTARLQSDVPESLVKEVLRKFGAR